jgi:hypothetical protein
MATDVVFMGWDRSVPGREAMSAEHFQEVLGWLGGLQQAGKIESFESVLLVQHGGDLNGFMLIRGSKAQIDTVTGTEEWMDHITRGGIHLEGFGVVRGVTGEGVMDWMGRWGRLIAS